MKALAFAATVMAIARVRDARDVGTGRLFAADQFPMNDG